MMIFPSCKSLLYERAGKIRAIYILTGEVIDSVISNNYTPRSGGGLYVIDGLITRCHIVNNRATGSSSSGGGLYTGYAILRNCLIANNESTYNGSAIFGSSVLINCTVVSNYAHNSSTRPALTGSFLTNCIVYFNTYGPDNTELNAPGSTGFYNCTTAPALAGTGNISDDPQFIDWENGDYRLSNKSPARRAGTIQGILDTVDLVGWKRISGGQIDMGAYQWMPSAGTVYTVY